MSGLNHSIIIELEVEFPIFHVERLIVMTYTGHPDKTASKKRRGHYCAPINCNNSDRNCNSSCFRFPKDEVSKLHNYKP